MGTVLVLAYAGVAYSSGGPGKTVQAVAASATDPKKKEFAKCLCDIIDGAPPTHPNPCLPKDKWTITKRMKSRGCIRIATEAEILPAIEASINRQVAGMPAARRPTAAQVHDKAVAMAKEQVAKGGGRNNQSKSDPALFFVWPSKMTGNVYEKKLGVFDEVNDLQALSSNDLAIAFPGPYNNEIQGIFDAAKTIYINMQSVQDGLPFLEGLKPTPPGQGASQAEQDAYQESLKDWWSTYHNADAYLLVLITQMCDRFVELNAKGVPMTNLVYVELITCKDKAKTCRSETTRPRLSNGGVRDPIDGK